LQLFIHRLSTFFSVKHLLGHAGGLSVFTQQTRDTAQDGDPRNMDGSPPPRPLAVSASFLAPIF
jgi:hypothetical protein